MSADHAAVDRVCGLLEYPDGTFAGALAGCRAGVCSAGAETAAELERFARAVEGLSTDQLQELYVETFDLTPGCTLDLGWHLYGDAYDRGALLAALRAELDRHEISEQGELPDHLPLLLRLLDRIERSRSAELRRLLNPAIDKLQAALVERKSPYVHLVKAAVAAIRRE